MKQQNKSKQPSKLEATSVALSSLGKLILLIIGLAIFIWLIISIIGAQLSKSGEDSTMSTGEAQKKCVVITLVGYQKEGIEQSVDEAQKHCMAMWDTPEREKTFIEFVTKEWEAWKNETIEGKTVEDLYEEMKESL